MMKDTLLVWILRSTLFVALATFSFTAVSSDVRTTEYRAQDGSRVLQQAITVDATLEEVWNVFTTREGWESWAVPFARVQFEVGGLIETSYDPAATPGDPANIRNRILSFLPYRMLSIQAVQAPPGFAYADLLPSLHSVIEFERETDERTLVAISGVGYRDGAGYDALIDFFRRGNAWTFERLKQRFAEGPLDSGTAVPQTSPDVRSGSER